MAHDLLRADLEISDARSAFERDGIVEVRRFLNPAWAEKLHRFFSEEMPTTEWVVAMQTDGKPQIYTNVYGDNAVYTDLCGKARRELETGQFSYCFRRTLGGHNKGCNCIECLFRAHLSGCEMLEFLDKLGIAVSGPGGMFASLYTPGSFLSPHNDGRNGAVAFVLGLSRLWRPEWGGLLIFLDGDSGIPLRVCAPEFNKLCLFEVSAERKREHFVSEVVAGERLAFTGWYVS